MNTMNKIFRKLAPAFAFIAVMSIMMPMVALAQSCADLKDPAKTKDWIVTILEESIGASPAEDNQQADTKIIDCVRQTTTDAKGAKTSEYVAIGSCSPGETTLCQRVQVIFAKSGAALLYSYISLVYRWAAGTIGVVSVMYMVYGGIRIASAGDNAGAIDEAKTKIMQSIAGLILLFLSAVILYTINPNFFTA
jgi:hypothetical protein